MDHIMPQRNDPIMALLIDSQLLSADVASAKGALLKSHCGKLFHGFSDGQSDANEQAQHRVQHAALKVLEDAGAHCKGATLYMTAPPCLRCSEAILAAGVRRVVHPDHCGEDQGDYRSCEEGNLLLGLNGVEVELWEPASRAMN